ncbi:hypothetical protein FQA39_LY07494 [Lamprigera yunnana]|nr:hypothetical protein FQA39_LY07494 [Lamprigera yunnana]
MKELTFKNFYVTYSKVDDLTDEEDFNDESTYLPAVRNNAAEVKIPEKINSIIESYKNYTVTLPSKRKCKQKKIQEALEMLLADDEQEFEGDLFIAPPEPSLVSDEDSGDEDSGGDFNNFNGNQLLANAELRP